jgi:DNA polymerase-3 subunit delta
MNSDHKEKYLIFGSAGFIESETEKIRSATEDPEENVWFGDELNMEELFGFVSAMSLFGGEKLAVIHRADKVKEPEELLKQLIRFPEAVIVATAEAESEKKLASHAGGFSVIAEKKKTRQNAAAEVKEVFDKNGLPCDSHTAEELLDIFIGDIIRIRSEADKLSIYFAGNPPKSPRDIINLITSEKQENIFAFIDSFAARNKKSTVRMLENLLRNGEAVGFLFIMLFRRVKMMYQQIHVPSSVKGHPFVINKVKADLSKWKKDEVSDLAGEFAELDYKLKTGQIKDIDALYTLISRI